LLDKVRAMLIDADLPQSYWYDALRYAAHIHNVTPTCALVDVMPEEAWSGNKPDISNLQTFGSWAFVHIPDSHRDKLSSHSLICTFLGLARQHKAYCLVHHQMRRFIESHDVIFDEGGAAPLGIVTGRVNPHGYGYGYGRVRVRVGILLPVHNPYPTRGYRGYRLTCRSHLLHHRPCR
jgi:hypothetical protein